MATAKQAVNNEFDIMFNEENSNKETTKTSEQETWKIIIVDDEEDVHLVTKMVLADFEFEGRKLEFISAYSGREARKVLSNNPDAAILLLDVVMEHDHAGLEVVKFVRNVLKNHNTRIVLRTGQPGQAPERDVITNYDINDYKEKTELTKHKLFTLTYSLLRSFRDIIAIERNKHGLEQVISASADIFKLKSLERFAAGVLEQMAALLMAEDGALIRCNGLAAKCDNGNMSVLTGIGEFSIEKLDELYLDNNNRLINTMKQVIKSKENLYVNDEVFCYFKTSHSHEHVFYLKGLRHLSDIDESLLKVFTRNVSIAFENVELHEEIEETQREIVYMLGEAVETRSKETGNHVKRVAEISRLLATEIGIEETEAEIIRLASPLHDLGKIGIPDAILNKPGRLDEAEMDIMKTHARLGHQMLSNSQRRILQAAAIIADQHHERWDGAGYPAGKNKNNIHIYGRITAIADVFDALGSERCYKKAWPIEKVLDYIKGERGKQFDPELVDALIDNIDTIKDIQKRFSDVA